MDQAAKFKNSPIMDEETFQALCKTMAPNVYPEVQAEQIRQIELHGLNDHEPFKYNNILLEEVGEAAKEINDAYFKGPVAPHVAKLRMELIQVAAVAISFVESIDRGSWLAWGKQNVELKRSVYGQEEAADRR